jgi:hypothetical protein
MRTEFTRRWTRRWWSSGGSVFLQMLVPACLSTPRSSTPHTASGICETPNSAAYVPVPCTYRTACQHCALQRPNFRVVVLSFGKAVFIAVWRQNVSIYINCLLNSAIYVFFFGTASPATHNKLSTPRSYYWVTALILTNFDWYGQCTIRSNVFGHIHLHIAI